MGLFFGERGELSEKYALEFRILDPNRKRALSTIFTSTPLELSVKQMSVFLTSMGGRFKRDVQSWFRRT